MTKLEPRNTQTRVKDEILASYLDTWGGIIVSRLRNARPDLPYENNSSRRLKYLVFALCEQGDKELSSAKIQPVTLGRFHFSGGMAIILDIP